MSGFHELLSLRPSSLFRLFGCNSNSFCNKAVQVARFSRRYLGIVELNDMFLSEGVFC